MASILNIPLDYPLINGVRPDYTSIEFYIAGVPAIFKGIQSVSYDDGLKPGKVWGTGPGPIGRTRGKYEPNAKLSMPVAEAEILIEALAAQGVLSQQGYAEVPFDLSILKKDVAGTAVIDRLQSCRIAKMSDSYKSGQTDTLMVDIDLDIMGILRNGNPVFFGQV